MAKMRPVRARMALLQARIPVLGRKLQRKEHLIIREVQNMRQEEEIEHKCRATHLRWLCPQCPATSPMTQPMDLNMGLLWYVPSITLAFWPKTSANKPSEASSRARPHFLQSVRLAHRVRPKLTMRICSLLPFSCETASIMVQ